LNSSLRAGIAQLQYWLENELGDRDSNAGKGTDFLLLIPVLGATHPPIKLVYRAIRLRLKQGGRGAIHSPPPAVEIKNTWSYTSIPPYVFIV
jgi:hypothetical protein